MVTIALCNYKDRVKGCECLWGGVRPVWEQGRNIWLFTCDEYPRTDEDVGNAVSDESRCKMNQTSINMGSGAGETASSNIRRRHLLNNVNY